MKTWTGGSDALMWLWMLGCTYAPTHAPTQSHSHTCMNSSHAVHMCSHPCSAAEMNRFYLTSKTFFCCFVTTWTQFDTWLISAYNLKIKTKKPLKVLPSTSMVRVEAKFSRKVPRKYKHIFQLILSFVASLFCFTSVLFWSGCTLVLSFPPSCLCVVPAFVFTLTHFPNYCHQRLISKPFIPRFLSLCLCCVALIVSLYRVLVSTSLLVFFFLPWMLNIELQSDKQMLFWYFVLVLVFCTTTVTCFKGFFLAFYAYNFI